MSFVMNVNKFEFNEKYAYLSKDMYGFIMIVFPTYLKKKHSQAVLLPIST